MKKEKVCKGCQVRESIHRTVTGKEFKNNRCKGCQ